MTKDNRKLQVLRLVAQGEIPLKDQEVITRVYQNLGCWLTDDELLKLTIK